MGGRAGQQPGAVLDLGVGTGLLPLLPGAEGCLVTRPGS